MSTEVTQAEAIPIQKQKQTKEKKSNLTEEEEQERKTRTVFVGNVPLESTSKELKQVFKQVGDVEKVWFRSIACDHDSKITHKGKIIKQ